MAPVWCQYFVPNIDVIEAGKCKVKLSEFDKDQNVMTDWIKAALNRRIRKQNSHRFSLTGGNKQALSSITNNVPARSFV